MAETRRAVPVRSETVRSETARTDAARSTSTGRAIVSPARYINTIGTSQTDTGPANVTYRPGPGDPQETEAYGKKFKAGESLEVPGQFVDKAKGNPYFDVAGDKAGSQPEAEEPVEQDEATFEENLARERSKEYLEGRTHFASPPGEADRLARAQEQAAELRAAQEDENDKDPEKPRGRRKAK